MPEGNKPQTYLNPSERQMQRRLFSAVEEFPREFIAWLDDHLKVNIPQFPVTQIHGFQNFNQTVQQIQQFLTDQLWEFIDAKGDLIVGVSNDHFTVVPVGTNGQVLIADSSQSAGVKWGAQSASAVGSRELQAATGSTVAVSAGALVTLGISSLLEAAGTITAVRAFVATPGSTDTVVTISGRLSTPITIPSGDLWDDGTAVISSATVTVEDLLNIVVSTAGTGAEGLGVIVTLG